jgi:DinB superfamily
MSDLKVRPPFATQILKTRTYGTGHAAGRAGAGAVIGWAAEDTVNSAQLVLALLDEAYEKKTWHGPNLKQSIKGVTAKQAAWRPGPGRHNIWEVALHAAYWKYAVRRRIEGGKRGSFVLKGHNFFPRPEKGKVTEAAWSADKKLLEREHRAMCAAIAKALRKPRDAKFLRQLYGVAFHDVYHAGQIRLLRRLQGR